jgi:hypothetical protein
VYAELANVRRLRHLTISTFGFYVRNDEFIKQIGDTLIQLGSTLQSLELLLALAATQNK